MPVYIPYPYLQTGGFQVVTSSYVVNVSVQYGVGSRGQEKDKKVGPVVEFRTGMGLDGMGQESVSRDGGAINHRCD